MKKSLILALVGVTLIAAGIAIGRYLSPASHSATPETTVSSATSSTQQSPRVDAPRNGIYIDGPNGTPHYFVSLTAGRNGTMSGSLQFFYQDGQTSVVLTFLGSWQRGVATLHPQTVPQDGSASQNPSTVPSDISLVYGHAGIVFHECVHYLHFVTSQGQCEFSYPPNGNMSGQ